jgi:hypothetical protein
MKASSNDKKENSNASMDPSAPLLISGECCKYLYYSHMTYKAVWNLAILKYNLKVNN